MLLLFAFAFAWFALRYAGLESGSVSFWIPEERDVDPTLFSGLIMLWLVGNVCTQRIHTFCLITT